MDRRAAEDHADYRFRKAKLITYKQATGEFRQYAQPNALGYGYAGHGEGKNNPAMEGVHNIGPLPRGEYRIGPAQKHKHLGLAMYLTPKDLHKMLNRGGFFIHLENPAHPGESSEGCPVVSFVLFKLIADSGDHDLKVV